MKIKTLILLTFLSFNLLSQTVIDKFPYYESFEGNNSLWTGSGDWELGEPNTSQIDYATSGSKVWATDLDYFYSNGAYDALESPYFDLSGATLPYISFQLAYYLESSYDYLFLQYSTDGFNWYTVPSGAQISRNYSTSWTGSSFNYQRVTTSLENLNLSAPIKFRFLLDTDGSVTQEGAHIDDIIINDFGNSRTDMEAIALRSFSTGSCNNQTSLGLIIQNNLNFSIPSNNITAKYRRPNGTIVTENLAISNFVGRDYYIHEFSSLPNVSDSIKAWVDLNFDNDRSNDSASTYFLQNNAIDLNLISINTPNSLLNCNSSVSNTLSVSIENKFSQSLTNVPIKFQVNNGNIISETISYLRANCDNNQYTNFTFNNKINYGNDGVYNIKVWLDLSFDTNSSNDTLNRQVNLSQPIQLPYIEDFVTGTPIDSSGNFKFPTGWASDSTIGWEIRNKIPDSANTGPYENYESGNFLYFNGDQFDIPPFSGRTLSVYSPCIEIPNDSNSYELSFFYHTHFGNSVSVAILDTLNSITNFALQSNSSRNNPYQKFTLNLDQFKGQPIKVLFSKDIRFGTFNLAIDNIRIYKKSSIDLSVSSINNLYGNKCGVESDSALNITVRNAGITDVNQFEICYQVNNSAEVCEIIGGGILAAGANESYNLANKIDLKQPGNYQITGYVKHPNDQTAFNDTFKVVFNNRVKTIPFIDRFDQNPFKNWNTFGPSQDYQWVSNSGFTPSTATGPIVDGDSSETGTYYYTESTGSLNSSEFAYLIFNKCFDFALGNAHFIHYDYHMYGSDIDRLYLVMSSDTGVTVIDSLIGAQQNSFNAPWKERSISADFIDSSIIATFFFIAYKKNTGDKSDIAIDNFGVRDTTVSLSEFNLKTEELTLYPNPSTGKYFIKSSESIAGYEYQILDLHGREVKRSTIKPQQNSFDLSDNAEGIYFLVIPEIQVKEKLIKY